MNLKIDSSAKYCKESCEKSLKTLGIDCIDICKISFQFLLSFQVCFDYLGVLVIESPILASKLKPGFHLL